MSDTSQAIMGMINAFLIFVWPVIFYNIGLNEGRHKGFRKGKAHVHTLIAKHAQERERCPICRNKITSADATAIALELTEWVKYPVEPLDADDHYRQLINR